MSSRIIITGSIQCGKSTLIRAVIDELNAKVCGYFSQKRWNQNKNRTEIWLIDYLTQNTTCFAFLEKEKTFRINLDSFDDFVVKSLAPAQISKSQMLCVDEIGFLEKKSAILRSKCEYLEILQIPILLVIQKRMIQVYGDYFRSPDWIYYDLDEVKSESINGEIIADIKPFL